MTNDCPATARGCPLAPAVNGGVAADTVEAAPTPDGAGSVANSNTMRSLPDSAVAVTCWSTARPPRVPEAGEHENAAGAAEAGPAASPNPARTTTTHATNQRVRIIFALRRSLAGRL